jgi:hypothetical protein
VRTVERAIVAAIVTTVPMIDSTIERSTLPLTVVPPLIRHHLPPGTMGSFRVTPCRIERALQPPALARRANGALQGTPMENPQAVSMIWCTL